MSNVNLAEVTNQVPQLDKLNIGEKKALRRKSFITTHEKLIIKKMNSYTEESKNYSIKVKSDINMASNIDEPNLSVQNQEEPSNPRSQEQLANISEEREETK